MTGRTTQSPTSDATDPFAPTIGLLGVLRILFRWSFVVAPLVAITIWVAFTQSEDIKPEYRASASLLLIGPSEVVLEDPDTGDLDVTLVNPLQQLGGTLTTVARVTVLAMSDGTVSAQLRDEGFTDAYTIAAEPRTPILRIEVTDENPDVAKASTDRLVELVFLELQSRQDDLNAPELNRIGAQLISSGLNGGADFGVRDRVRIAIAAVGFAASAAMAFVLEGLAELWRRYRARKSSEVAQLALMAGSQTDDRRALLKFETSDELVAAEHETLLSVLQLQIGDDKLAAAIADEAIAATAEHWSELTEGEEVDWLFGTALRQAWQLPEHEVSVHPVDNTLWTAIHLLPPKTRSVLALAYVGDFTETRIARALGLKVADVLHHRNDAAEILARLNEGTLDPDLDPTDNDDSEDRADEPHNSTNDRATDNSEADTTEPATDNSEPDTTATTEPATDNSEPDTTEPATDNSEADTTEPNEPATDNSEADTTEPNEPATDNSEADTADEPGSRARAETDLSRRNSPLNSKASENKSARTKKNRKAESVDAKTDERTGSAAETSG